MNQYIFNTRKLFVTNFFISNVVIYQLTIEQSSVNDTGLWYLNFLRDDIQ